MRYLLLIGMILLFACGGTDNSEDVPPGYRILDDEEYVVWELTVGCFMEHGGPFWEDVGYVEPYIRVEAEISALCPAEGSIACASVELNAIIVDSDFYYTESGINKGILVHEFKHTILKNAGSYTWNDHSNYWFSEDSPCKDGMLN